MTWYACIQLQGMQTLQLAHPSTIPFPQGGTWFPPMVIYIPTVQSFFQIDLENRSPEAVKANIGMARKGVLGYWSSVE